MAGAVAPFGDGVQAITLTAGALSARVLTLGAILQSVRLDGVAHDLTLGLPDVPAYRDGRMWQGSIVGPVANRIGGATAMIGGQVCRFEANFLGRHALHSGSAGVCHKRWRLALAEADRAVMTLDLADGEGGYPGNRRVTADFAVASPAVLRLTITTETDAATAVNLTNHSYWNLDGAPSWAGHHLRIAADSVLDLDAELIPTGGLVPLEGDRRDLRQGRIISPADYAADDNYCLAPGRRDLTEVLWLTGRSGLRLAMATTEPGMQVYDGRALGHAALALEAQGWPDALHHAHFPPILAEPGMPVVQITEWRFARA